MKRSRQRHLLFFSIALMALSFLFQGCESAESYASETGVEAGENGGGNGGGNPDTGGGGTGGGGTGGGTNNSNDPTFNPSSVDAFYLEPKETTISRNERKRFTIPSPRSGYAYTWRLENGSIGELTRDSTVSTGTAYYYQGTEFPAGGATQKILVVGTLSGSNIRHEGRATVTHQAP